MLHSPRSFFMAFLLTATGGGVHASVLHADGIIRVKGDAWRGTRVTVIPEFSQPYDVDLSSARFDLHLPLQSTYLVRAEHVNCPTKEVVFDLRVPAAAMDQEYDFPFEIILEVRSEGVELRYAGPVGLVSFDKAANDFDYITDHRLIALMPKADELRDRAPAELRPQVKGSAPAASSESGASGPVPAAVNTTTTVPPAADMAVTTEPVPLPVPAMPAVRSPLPAPTTSRTVATVDPDVHIIQPLTVLPIVEPVAPFITGRRTLEPATVRTSTAKERASRASVALVPGVRTTAVEQVVHAQCGTEETLTSGRMVIHIQRVATVDGGCQELRTVTHAYGAVFHFHDGRPVTEAFLRTVLAAQ